MRIEKIENENLDESVQAGDIVSFEFGDKLAVEGLVVETEDGLAVELDEQGEQYLTELIPLAIAAGGLAWSAYDAYNAAQALQRGEITQNELAAQVGTDLALSLAGGALAKGVGKGFKHFSKMWKKQPKEPTLPRDMGPAPTGPNGRPLSPMSGREEPPLRSNNTPDAQRQEPTLTRRKNRNAPNVGATTSSNNELDTDFIKKFGPNAQRGKMNDDVQRLRTLSGLTEEYLVEGTWAVPNTMELAKKLEAVMANPIPAKDASDVMYSLIGDDELFDSLYELETDDPSADARPTITRWIQSNRKLLDFNTDDKEVMSVIDNIAGINEEHVDEAYGDVDFGMFTPGGDAQVQNIIQYTLNDFEDEAEKATSSERDALRMEAMQKLFKELEDLAEDPKHEEAMDTDVRERAAAYLDKGIIRIMDMLDNQPVSEEEIDEAEYQGRKVELNKPTRGDVKKFKVYVKNDKGNVVKVNFGHKGKGNEKTMRIKKSDPKRRKSFRARHNCDNPGPKWKARYWSCRAW